MHEPTASCNATWIESSPEEMYFLGSEDTSLWFMRSTTSKSTGSSVSSVKPLNTTAVRQYEHAPIALSLSSLSLSLSLSLELSLS